MLRRGSVARRGPRTDAGTRRSLQLRALAAYRDRQDCGEDVGFPHDEAYRRVFGGGDA
ncbi:hypothetical protein LUW75_15530 [Streptomyces sp. MRC013]|uniref:hypothetical protein n=1 Tax=Streptomyces sp. MRC013 TaxID=2898276 RepID=UPI0020267B4A|nr:hypothetical protein [Streptomyces sp. MRC013]URM91156.1 hypothetical protein LUW75_15530 [Streptomyces sp. MRC013]